MSNLSMIIPPLYGLASAHNQVNNQGRCVRFAREGQISPYPPWRVSPSPKLILCEIYHLISSFCLQMSYHLTPKIRDIKSQGLGGVVTFLWPPYTQWPLLTFSFHFFNLLSRSFSLSFSLFSSVFLFYFLFSIEHIDN